MNKRVSGRFAAVDTTCAGVVKRAIDGRIVVAIDGQEIVARRAFSCLLEPMVGDNVLVVDENETTWVIAILERECSDDGTVSIPGELTLKGISVHVAASDRLSLTGCRVSIVGQLFEAAGATTQLLFERLRVRGVVADSELGTARVVASSIETIADRLSERLRNAFRFVTGRDQLRAEHIDHAAEKNAVLRGENTVISAEDLVKMDAKQVHVG